MTKCFDSQRSGTGTREWADTNYNITEGCRNACLYCYAAEMAHRLRRKSRADWENETLTSKAFVQNFQNRTGVIMFPSTHDITPFNIHDYCLVSSLMLSAGNHLLITSKPRPAMIRKLLTALSTWRDQIMFRFTIGTLNTAVSKYWEPGAPSPQERILALKESFDAGFRTSVSIEPLLGGADDANLVVQAVRPFVTDTIWIGKLNQGKRRVSSEHRAAVDFIEFQQRDDEILRLVEMLKSVPEVRWKDSIVKVMKEYGFET